MSTEHEQPDTPRGRRRKLFAGVALLAVAGGACGDTAETTLPTSTTTTAVALATTTGLPAPTSTNLPPVTGTLRVEGALVRDAPATAIAEGLPAGKELTLVVSDARQRIPVGYITPAIDGTARIDFLVPSVGMHEGICVDGPCEYEPVHLGDNQLSLSHTAYDLTGALTIDIDIVSAQRNVPYPVRVTGECGPVRTHADGRVWLADSPERFDAPGEPELGSLSGTLTITGATTALFRAEDGRTGRFTEGPRHFC